MVRAVVVHREQAPVGRNTAVAVDQDMLGRHPLPAVEDRCGVEQEEILQRQSVPEMLR